MISLRIVMCVHFCLCVGSLNAAFVDSRVEEMEAPALAAKTVVDQQAPVDDNSTPPTAAEDSVPAPIMCRLSGQNSPLTAAAIDEDSETILEIQRQGLKPPSVLLRAAISNLDIAGGAPMSRINARPTPIVDMATRASAEVLLLDEAYDLERARGDHVAPRSLAHSGADDDPRLAHPTSVGQCYPTSPSLTFQRGPVLGLSRHGNGGGWPGFQYS